jgi:alkylation response protein AidB-like acyl-CoA dehydrogenase
MIDFSASPEQEQIRKAIGRFMEEYVYPAQVHLTDEPNLGDATFFPGVSDKVLRPIQTKAKELGFWALHMPEAVGGMELGVVGLALVNEIIGRSPLGPISFGCQAPDAGNCEILHVFGSDEQKRRISCRTWRERFVRVSP